MTISIELSRKISRIGVGCAMLVVFIHSYLVTGPGESMEPIAAFVQEFVSQGLTRIAVPFFFIVSGFFLYRDFELSGRWYLRKIKSRFFSLVIPYVLWGLISLFFAVVTSLIARKTYFAAFEWSSLLWWCRVFGLTDKPLYCGQLWFVHKILEWLLVAPLIGYLVTRIRFWLPVLCFAFLCLPLSYKYWVEPLMYITLGACIAQSGVSMSACPNAMKLGSAFRRFRIFVILLAVAWLCLIAIRSVLALNSPCPYRWSAHLFGYSVPFMHLINFTGLAAVWGGYELIAGAKWWSFIDKFTGASFFIYCTHMMFLALIRSPFRRVSLWEVDVLRYLVPPILAILFAIVSWKWFCRVSPALQKLLCGGRS